MWLQTNAARVCQVSCLLFAAARLWNPCDQSCDGDRMLLIPGLAPNDRSMNAEARAQQILGLVFSDRSATNQHAKALCWNLSERTLLCILACKVVELCAFTKCKDGFCKKAFL